MAKPIVIDKTPSHNVKPRLAYIDIAKGILICCLIYGHMFIFAQQIGINDPIMKKMWELVPLYNTFFMQTFFIITGFCSSFNKTFTQLCKDGVKTLIIPAVLLGLISDVYEDVALNNTLSSTSLLNIRNWLNGGGPWFIVTLFWTKIILWCILLLPFRKQVFAIFLVYITGIILNIIDIFPNYFYHRHVFLVLLYMWLGYYLSLHQELKRMIPRLAFFGIIFIGSQFFLSFCVDFRIPTHDFYIANIRYFYIHIINVITGSAFVFYVSQKIETNKFFETMGIGSLIVYLWNGMTNNTLLRFFMPLYNKDSLLSYFLFHFSVFVSMLIVFYCIIKIVYYTSYLKWLVGKW